jgi:hypothetical protein
MRPLATWLVVGGLAVLGLFAARDALHGKETAPASHTFQQADRRVQSPPGFAGPPRIDRRLRLSAELRRLGAHGVLYLTDANCRRFLLRLPSLRWTTPQGLTGPDCTGGPQPVVDERFGVAAEQVSAETIETRAEGWRLRFEGSGPAFKPAGTLTFLRGERLYEWTVRCPPGVQTTTFRGLHPLERCARAVPGAPERLREVVWLSGDTFAAVAGQDRYSSLILVREGRPTELFRAIGVRMGALSASPHGRYVAALVGESLVVFDAAAPGATLPGVQGARAVAWSPDDRLSAVATESSISIFPSAKPGAAEVVLPLSAFGLDWR